MLVFLKSLLNFKKYCQDATSFGHSSTCLQSKHFRDRQEDSEVHTRLDSKRPCLKHKNGVGVGCHGWQSDCLACIQAWVQFPAPHTLGICNGHTPTLRKETGGSVQGQPQLHKQHKASAVYKSEKAEDTII